MMEMCRGEGLGLGGECWREIRLVMRSRRGAGIKLGGKY